MKNRDDMMKMIKEAGVLLAITLVAGLLLGFVYELTKEPIARQQELKVQRACAAVSADAASFELLPAANGIVENDYTQATAENGTRVSNVYSALAQDGSVIGYVIEVSSSEGYGGEVSLMMGVSMDGTVQGISFLTLAETPGLGMRAPEVLSPQFTGKTVTTFTVTKTGAMAESEIDAISGATITSNAVTDAVNTGLAYFRAMLQEGGN